MVLSNGICERFHRTIKDEFYSIAFRKKIYHSLEELQDDVDQWIDLYNHQRPHPGSYCFGKTPMQTWRESKKLALDKLLHNQHEALIGHRSAELPVVRS
jgi:hypothetical protein